MDNAAPHYDEAHFRQAAKLASLRYVRDTMPGITRRRAGRGYAYYAPDGSRITDRATRRRIDALAIPPAYKEVWICPLANGHLQATGRDDAGRKQYRYHPDWEKVRDESKFERILAFGALIPKLREQVDYDLRHCRPDRECILAALVKIMEQSYIRVGNAAYAEAHQTYGLTTLRKKHVQVEGSTIHMAFRGKNGTPWHIDIRDRKLARVIRKCEAIPGYELFKYIDEHGEKRVIRSEDVNDYLRDITGENFTAKDFRTWAACKETFRLLCSHEVPPTKKEQQAVLKAAICEVAELLGHTPAVCRKSYIHPQLLLAWQQGDLHAWGKKDVSDAGFLAWWKASV